MNWFYVDGPRRVGPLSDSEWADLVRSGKIQPETLVWHEGLPAWTPHAEIPPPLPTEKELEESAPPESQEDAADAEVEEQTPEQWMQQVLARDYQVSIRGCLARAWDLFKAHFWMLAGSTFLILTIILICPLRFIEVGLLTEMALQGVFLAGLCNVYLRLMRGEPVFVADLAAGFEWRVFRQLVLKTFITFLAGNACFIPFVIVSLKTGVDLANMEAKMQTDPQAVALVMIVFLICSIPKLFLSFVWMFATPLIFDKGLTFTQALSLSRRMVMRHPWKVGLLTLVSGIVGGVGLIVFTAPLYFAATLYLYEDIFTRPAPEGGDEPPRVTS